MTHIVKTDKPCLHGLPIAITCGVNKLGFPVWNITYDNHKKIMVTPFHKRVQGGPHTATWHRSTKWNVNSFYGEIPGEVSMDGFIEIHLFHQTENNSLILNTVMEEISKILPIDQMFCVLLPSLMVILTITFETYKIP